MLIVTPKSRMHSAKFPAIAALLLLMACATAGIGNENIPAAAPVVAVTSGPKHHFFGYYDKHQFDASNRYILGHKLDIFNRRQRADDVVGIGMVDTRDGNKWIPLAETRAWSWQMGSMLQWLPGKDARYIYNDRRDGKLVAVIRDINGGEEKVLPHPIFWLSPDGKAALSLNFSRLFRLRPETGYCGVHDPYESEAAPENDGIFRVDLQTGRRTLIISLRDMADKAANDGKGKLGLDHYFTHPVFNQSGSRFYFWHRWHGSEGENYSQLYTANGWSEELRLLNPELTSHTAWLGDDRVVAWCRRPGNSNWHYHVFDDNTGECDILGKGILVENGHLSFSPDGKWMLTDERTNDGRISLLLYHVPTNRRIEIGRFYTMRELECEFRCDLHPRWNRNCTKVCIDSTHEGTRQMYVVDIEKIVKEYQ